MSRSFEFSYYILKIFLSIILFFSIIYMYLEEFDFGHSFYFSTMVSCTIGPPQEPKNSITKLFISAQAIITIILGIAIFSRE